PTADGTGTPEFRRLAGRLDALRHLIAGVVSWRSVVLDGPCGHHNALQMTPQSHRHLRSKRRCEAARSLPSAGPSAGRGPRRQEGRPGPDAPMPAPSLTETPVA